ncbi:hypothetical protein [Paenibacillus qinlingensis]|uniref:Uncharacterized protein n=1 Tax=Paenibacillus qinlingensis TaxID=1837343 RepID=A0ABU1P6M6_9BACL|nr:hypothetical protein [Paenibacillus qinlingensis]MDR6555415.1 hypothetical protein [Paenibacillus qinlingensis]
MEERILSATELTMQYNSDVHAIRTKHFVKSLDPAQALDWKEAHTPSKEEVERALKFYSVYKDRI